MGLNISIHALREEGDPEYYRTGCAVKNFYPRPPRGGRLAGPPAPPTTEEFLSTPSARRATLLRLVGCFRSDISIHALREEGDVKMVM